MRKRVQQIILVSLVAIAAMAALVMIESKDRRRAQEEEAALEAAVLDAGVHQTP